MRKNFLYVWKLIELSFKRLHWKHVFRREIPAYFLPILNFPNRSTLVETDVVSLIAFVFHEKRSLIYGKSIMWLPQSTAL